MVTPVTAEAYNALLDELLRIKQVNQTLVTALTKVIIEIEDRDNYMDQGIGASNEVVQQARLVLEKAETPDA